MNDEIKEMTKVLKSLGNKQASELYNYITNLQQENERLKKLEYKFIDNCGENESFTLEEYLDISNKLYDSEREKEDYKSRIEKAIEYLEQHKFNKFGDIDCGEAEEIIDILNGKE